jgi:thiol-disulfide isomerase/thioredoxin
MQTGRWTQTLLAGLAALALAASGGAPPPAPELAGEVWLNSPPRTLAELRGKVVLVEFWTFACRNCRNVEPDLRAWHERWADQGLVVIGVHTPELDHERDLASVKRYLAEQRITWPVLVDNGFHTWRAYGNRYWPAFYLIDAQGRIRHRRFGEGGAAELEAWIERLLAERAG